jgi:hypothetical protein
MIFWVVGEVKAVPDTVWRLNDNFTILGIEGVLNMLNGKGCQGLNRLHNLAASCDTDVLEDVPEDVHRLEGRIMQRWWKPHGLPKALHQLEATRPVIVSNSNN